MGKKLKLLPSLLMRITEPNNNNKSSSSWPWPSCHQQPRTLSFRAVNNLAFLDATMDMLESSESFFTVSPDSGSFSAASGELLLEDSRTGGSDRNIESVIRGLRSDRLFFEPDETSSILESNSKSAGATAALPPFKDSVVLSVESRDPFVDFRKSMKEMVEAHGVKDDWEGLQELLGWYLKVNDKTNHGYVVGAFVDLLVGLAFSSAVAAATSSSTTSSFSSYSSNSHSPSSPLSFYSSNSVSSSSCSTRYVSCLDKEVEVAPSPSSSSLLLEQVREEINLEHEALSSSSSSNT